MTDLKLLLEDLKEESESGRMPVGSARSVRHRWPLLLMVVAFIITATGVGLWLIHGRESEQPSVVPLTTFVGSEDYPSFSPDGREIASPTATIVLHEHRYAEKVT